ncbi:MAG: hypothetical protein JNK77_17995 [Saprospiraceae bacterium]|nr:hypothetical protein [Saprospiraceae bacterium]
MNTRKSPACMENIAFCAMAALFIACVTPAQAQSTLAERLGYPADSKLLIIHADDLAVAHAENQASFKGMEKGAANVEAFQMGGSVASGNEVSSLRDLQPGIQLVTWKEIGKLMR